MDEEAKEGGITKQLSGEESSKQKDYFIKGFKTGVCLRNSKKAPMAGIN